MEIPRLIFVHAHPDDETLTTGATIAHYTALGAQVRVVTCTLGEEGEVIGDRWAQLAVDGADQLGGYRIGELSAALNCLGVAEPVFLGGAGHWRDSGMDGTPARQQQRFVDADPAEPATALAEIIVSVRPHVVVSYDANGGYGHPDHIRAHETTVAAVAAAARHPRTPWEVPKVYWTVMSRTAADSGLRDIASADVPSHWTRLPASDFPFFYDDEQIDAVVHAPASRTAKVAAMRAHATQVTVTPDGAAFALSNDIVLPVLDSEHYVLAGGTAGERDARGWETDLLAGLNLS